MTKRKRTCRTHYEYNPTCIYCIIANKDKKLTLPETTEEAKKIVERIKKEWDL